MDIFRTSPVTRQLISRILNNIVCLFSLHGSLDNTLPLPHPACPFFQLLFLVMPRTAVLLVAKLWTSWLGLCFAYLLGLIAMSQVHVELKLGTHCPEERLPIRLYVYSDVVLPQIAVYIEDFFQRAGSSRKCRLYPCEVANGCEDARASSLLSPAGVSSDSVLNSSRGSHFLDWH